jgi:translation factor GUF1, mitochondrial
VLVSNPTEFPDVTDTTGKVKEIQEPIVKASIIVPEGEAICVKPEASTLTYTFLRILW